MRSNSDTHFLQPLLAKTACDAQRCRQSAGEMSAAGGILEASVFDLGRVVRMAGSGLVLQVRVVPGTNVLISNHRSNRGAAGISINNSTKKFGTVIFLAWGRPVVLARCPSVQELLKLFCINS